MATRRREPSYSVLPEQQFNQIVAGIRDAAASKVQTLEAGLAKELARLGVKQNGRKAVKDQVEPHGAFDVRSIITWAERIDQDCTDAIVQLVALHATAWVRTH